MKYYNKANGTEVFNNPRVPKHLQYDESNPDHVPLPNSNVFFQSVPEGKVLHYNPAGVPDGYEDV